MTGQGSGVHSNSNTGCCFCQQDHTPGDCSTVTSREERRKILKTSGRCFSCLRKGHLARQCRSRVRCQNCNGRHHTSICLTPKTVKQESTNEPTSGSQTKEMQKSSINTRLDPHAPSFHVQSNPTKCCLAEANGTILLQTAQVPLYNPTNPCCQQEVSLIFDSGSQRSYISKKASQQLNLKPHGKQVMSIMTFGANSERQQCYEKVQVGIRARKGESSKEVSLLTVPIICQPITGQINCSLVTKYPYLSQLELADNGEITSDPTEPDVLIGLDHYWEFMTGETIRCENGPVAVRTVLGWVISGPIPALDDTDSSTNLITHTLKVGTSSVEASQRLEQRLKSFWELESFGVVDSERTLYDQFHDVVKFVDGRYEVQLPWKDTVSVIPHHYELCLKRLHSLLRRLRQNPKLLEQYDSVIQSQVQSTIVQPVEHPEQVEGDRLHYLPHHAVVKHEKDTTKVRVVYDASARSVGPSLNECLHIGPKFNQKIFDILLRFRLHKTAVIADIEKAFLMISIHKRDRDVLRFLWVKDIHEDPPQVQVFRFTRVMFGVASSPFLLNATIGHHLKGYQTSHRQLIDKLQNSIYVDDVISGADEPEAAHQLYSEAKEILKAGGFNLRKFKTNDLDLQRRIDELEGTPKATSSSTESETYAKFTLGKSQKTSVGEQKTLGVRWKTETDEFVFDMSEVIQAAEALPVPTKRHVTSIVGRIYDPLGILAPAVIPFKIFFKELCANKVQWDEPLSEMLQKKWKTLIDGLRHEHAVVIPRCLRAQVTVSFPTTYQLCGFGDASCKAYAAVIYLLIQNEEKTWCTIICSKTRVSPVKQLTIPRLELLSALLLARLISAVQKSFDGVITLLPPLCFLDSKVALYWVCGSEKSWQPFVQNRVIEIRRLVSVERWRHCPGNANPADAPSRGQGFSDLAGSRLWFNGPEWLINFVSNQQIPLDPTMPSECMTELKQSTSVHTVMSSVADIGMHNLIEINNFSDINKLLRVTAQVLLFTKKVRNMTLPTTVELLSEAENLWILEAQASLRTDAKYDSMKTQLGLFTDLDGLTRCRGRLKNADIPYVTQFPLIMPRKHPLTLLLVKQAHDSVFHNGVKETLAQIRSKYWIIKGRSLVKWFINRCVLCRRMEGLPYNSPPPPPLPAYRVQEAPPFSYTGLDFAGPIFVRMEKNANCTSKAWICLYTCCITRAIHLDLVIDMTTQSFIRCFKRFVARRGLPSRIVSDNAKTFKGAAKTLKRILSHRDVQEHLAGVRVDWTFNVERAPWWGGIFERLVRSTKRCLRKMVGRAKLQYEELLTLLCEIEMVINSRPLSFISSDDLEEPLTPCHLLVGRRLLSLPDNLVHSDQDEFDPNTTPEILNRRMRFLNNMVDRFWQRWKTEYLLELRNSHRLREKHATHRTVCEGDIVVIHDENERRGFWKLGVVMELIPGKDGHVRSAKVKVVSRGKSTIWKRPVQRLYPLEINCLRKENSEIETDEPEMSNDLPLSRSSSNTSNSRPRRAAAMEAMRRIGVNPSETIEP